MKLRLIKGSFSRVTRWIFGSYEKCKLVAVMGRKHKEVVVMVGLSLDLASIHFKIVGVSDICLGCKQVNRNGGQGGV